MRWSSLSSLTKLPQSPRAPNPLSCQPTPSLTLLSPIIPPHTAPTHPQIDMSQRSSSTQHIHLTNVPVGEWDTLRIDQSFPPIYFGRGILKGRKLTDNFRWTKCNGRQHAFVGDVDARYTFGKNITLDTRDQTSQATDEVMDLAKEIKFIIREHALTKASCLRDLHLPHCDVASIACYPPGGGIPPHTDNELEHSNHAIISVSFGSRATMLLGKEGKEMAIYLHDGDILVFDRRIRHSIKDVQGPTGRLNVTYRSWHKPFHFPGGFAPSKLKRKRASGIQVLLSAPLSMYPPNAPPNKKLYYAPQQQSAATQPHRPTEGAGDHPSLEPDEDPEDGQP